MAIGAQTRRATTLDRLQRTVEAEAAWEQVYRSAPPDMHTGIRLGRAFSLVRLGNLARAIEVAEQVAGQQNLSEDDMYNCACVLALASAAATSEPEVKDRSEARAVELLQRIGDKYFNAERLEHMKHDADLDSLRERADYRKWLAELEAALIEDNTGDSELDDRDGPN
jgi:tetratricopeptide (TPR) repeat protein